MAHQLSEDQQRGVLRSLLRDVAFTRRFKSVEDVRHAADSALSLCRDVIRSQEYTQVDLIGRVNRPEQLAPFAQQALQRLDRTETPV